MRSIKSVLLALLMALGATAALVSPASAAVSITSLVVGGELSISTAQGTTYYSRSGQTQTVYVFTSSDAKCVEISGTFTAKQTYSPGKEFWVFTTTTPAGEGTKAVTAVASPSINPQGNCTGNSASVQGSYVLDNTGPVVTPILSPAANANGWNSANTQLSWSANDASVGVDPNTRPAAETISSNGTTTRSVTVKDYLGNSTTATTTVRVDKAAPSITATQTTAGPGQPTTVTFTCTDNPSTDASGIASCLAGGSATNSRTISGNGSVTGTATDRAGNTQTLTVQVTNVDTTAPVLSGTPTTSPNGSGWYRGDVTVRWNASDTESGIPVAPRDTTITGEGTGLTSSTTVSNGAGLSTTATSSPAVKIDRTAPATGISGAPTGWTNGTVSLSLNATDNLSGVDRTVYSVDGGPEQSGTSVVLATEGQHTVDFHSVDMAGNVEATQQATLLIDKSAPAISHRFTPTGYADGAWTNQAVTVTFDCTDAGGSGLASCTAPVTKSNEGRHSVVGTATDGAGSSATDTASVLLDRTGPDGSATVVGVKSEAGWYAADARVEFACTDPDLADGSEGSGVASCPGAKDLPEGATSGASGTASDHAGNDTSLGINGIKVDETTPVLTASYSKAWTTGDVTVDWSCTDGLSGIVGPGHTTVTVSGEGDNLTSTQTCSDKAGNSVTETVDGIRIDRHAPTTMGSVPTAPTSGWYTGGVEVTLDADDNLSKVATTHYTVDDGDPQVYDGPFTVTGDGEHAVSFHSTDVAGNVEESPAPVTFRIDTTAPVTEVTNPISPASGWIVTSGVPFSFGAKDAHSGIAATYYTIDDGARQTYGEPFDEDLSDGKHSATVWSVDVAGNEEAPQTFPVWVDSLPPTISGSQTPARNSHGWNNTDVEVTFSCADDTSGVAEGVAGCAGDTTLTNEGEGQEVVGDAVDNAGLTGRTTYGPVNIDKTAPTLTGVAGDPNAADWYRGDVTVDWIGDDGLSGIDPATQPDPTTVTGEGRNRGASATIQDKAGNTGNGSVSGLKIDRGAPTVTGKPTTSPNAAGWYSGEVVVDWTCVDPELADGTDGSGVASCPTSNPVRGDGAAQSTTSGIPEDVAGNLGDSATVFGINIDGTAPSTTADNQCTATNDWCTGSTANVVVTAQDQAGLSGVKEIRYRVNGGDLQVVAGATATVVVPLSGSGTATVEYWAVDRADNVEKSNKVSLMYDNIAPTVSHALSPTPNADEWNNSDVTVTFTARDDDAGSGVAPGSVTAPVTVSTETAGKVVSGMAKDVAGNTGSDSVTVRLDKTRPTITAAITAGTLGDNGWYTGPVTVRFTCADALSGVVACPDPVVLTDNGANAVTRSVSDRAGNSASASLTGIRIDQEKPDLTAADVNVANGAYTLGTAPQGTCTARDTVSGVASCTVTVTGGTTNGVGEFSWRATARDRAGNTTTVSGTYKVTYRFDGFLQPINDTAHQIGTSTSMFKAGQTIPVKLHLKNAAGQVVQPVTAPDWTTPVKGSATTAPVNETAYATTSDSGSDYRYDATSQQWIYNWQTGKTGGNYWRIGVRLDDGQTYYVNIGLR